VRNYLRRHAPLDGHAEERVILPLEDGTGDRLAAMLNRPAVPVAGRPLVILIHGLTGDEVSVYIKRSASNLLAEGYPVLRLNLRGAGPSRPLSRLQYHAGRTADLEMALQALPPALTAHGLAAVGFSLGGNMLLKYLGECGRAAPLRAAISVSAPIDLAATSRRMEDWRNSVYRSYMMGQMRAEATAPASDITPAEPAPCSRPAHPRIRPRCSARRETTSQCRRILRGQRGAELSRRHWRCQTLVIHALDDPWVPASLISPMAGAATRRSSHCWPPRGGMSIPRQRPPRVVARPGDYAVPRRRAQPALRRLAACDGGIGQDPVRPARFIPSRVSSTHRFIEPPRSIAPRSIAYSRSPDRRRSALRTAP